MSRRIITLGLIVVAILGLWSAAWVFLASEIRTRVAALAVDDGSGMPNLTCAKLDIAGFPFRFDVRCTGARVWQDDLSTDIAGVTATVLVYQPFHMQIFAYGPAAVTDAFTGSQRRLDWQELRASARLADWRIARVSVTIDKPVWTDTLVGDTLLSNADHVELHLVDIPGELDEEAHTAALAVSARLTNVAVPGMEIDQGQATLDAEITGLPDNVQRYADPDPLRRWQAAGGELRIVTLEGRDTDQSFDVSGKLSLDDAGRPQGQLAIATRGLVEHIEPMLPSQLKPFIVGNPAPDGSYRQTLTMAGGVVFSGIVPAGFVPPLW